MTLLFCGFPRLQRFVLLSRLVSLLCTIYMEFRQLIAAADDAFDAFTKTAPTDLHLPLNWWPSLGQYLRICLNMDENQCLHMVTSTHSLTLTWSSFKYRFYVPGLEVIIIMNTCWIKSRHHVKGLNQIWPSFDHLHTETNLVICTKCGHLTQKE